MAKFSEKNILLFVKKQSVVGTPVVPAGADVIACLSLDYNSPIQTEAFQYVGSDVDRDEITTVTDRTTEMKVQVLSPRLGTVAGTLAASPLQTLFEVSNCNVAITGTSATSKVTISNATSNSSVATAQFRRTTPDIATHKTFEASDAQATVDFELMVGGRTKWSFNLKGSFKIPTQETAISPVWGTMKDLYAPVVRQSTLLLAEAYPYGVIPGGTTNLCLSKISGTNVFGQQLDRALTACDETYNRSSVPGDFVITIREDSATESATNVEWFSKVGNYYGFNLKWADKLVSPTVGTTTKINVAKMQLVDVQKSSVSGYAGLDLKFRIVSNFDVIFDSVSTGTT